MNIGASLCHPLVFYVILFQPIKINYMYMVKCFDAICNSPISLWSFLLYHCYRKQQNFWHITPSYQILSILFTCTYVFCINDICNLFCFFLFCFCFWVFWGFFLALYYYYYLGANFFCYLMCYIYISSTVIL